MRKRSIWLAALLALVASLIVGPGATAGTEKSLAGTVVFIHDQEPPTLRGDWTDNNLYATALITNRIFDGCEKRDEKGNLVPQLCRRGSRHAVETGDLALERFYVRLEGVGIRVVVFGPRVEVERSGSRVAVGDRAGTCRRGGGR